MNKPEAIPEFTLGEHFIQLRPNSGNHDYRFLLIEDLEIPFLCPLLPKGQHVLFKDKGGTTWMEMTRKSIIIHKGYAWDGCTPKKWLGIWWGVPDFPDTIMASLVHDSLIQFSETKHFTLSRFEIDNIFKEILKLNQFTLYQIYYLGARFGSRFFKSKYKNIKSELISE